MWKCWQKSSSWATAAFLFLLKKPLNVEVLSSPHKKSCEHHQSPGFKGRGRQASFGKALLADSKGPSSSRLLQVWIPTTSCLGSKSQSSQEECELGIVEADPKVCVQGPCLPKCPECEVWLWLPISLECLRYSGIQPDLTRSHQSFMPGIRPKSVTGNIPPVLTGE